MKVHETASRSLLKTISYRVLIMTADAVIIYVITNRVDITLGVLIFSNISSTIFYFLHERFWNKVRWGKVVRK